MSTLDPHFKLVYLAVLIITGTLIIVLIGAAFLFSSPMTDAQKMILPALTHGFAGCVGFLIGGYGNQRASATRRR